MANQFSILPPAQSPLIRSITGITTDWRAFFSQLPARTGPAITKVKTDGTATIDNIAAAVNAILSEIRAQLWVDGGNSGAGPAGAFANAVRAVNMIPAAGDFVYNTTDIQYYLNDLPDTTHVTLNTHNDGSYTDINNVVAWPNSETDFSLSLALLQSQLPNCKSVNLFVGWFFDDLRAGQCKLQPRVSDAGLITGTSSDWTTTPAYGGDSALNLVPWRVAGLYRNQVPVITKAFGSPAYGSTPSDSSVIEGIAALKAAGLAVTFTPFLFGDIPNGSSLPSPYGGTQPAYPWRGRITCTPAPGVAGTPDKTGAAADEISLFVNGTWGYRNFILHYANLCAQAGGVDTFVIGSEMRGLTWVRSSATQHPFVDALVQLAADVRAILPDANIVYTADWSEWANYNPSDGTGDLSFHLDPLWSSPAIAAICLDNYMPLTDWRVAPIESPTNIDGLTYSNIYDWNYMMGNCAGGELFDWYYANSDDRYNQVRTPITDGAYGKPWVYRLKDIVSWWSNQHFSRIGGVELRDPTAWVPQSKPVWFMECGAAAVDKSSNQPNVFVDPKSSESFYPYFSSGARDDGIQRRYAQSWIRHFDPTDGGFVEANNPISSVYGGRMLDVMRIFLYTWDARPYPIFPDRSDIWSDASNYNLGDWLTGRIPSASSSSGSSSSGGSSVAGLTTTAPFQTQICDPKTGELDRLGAWWQYLQALGYTRQGAISNVSAESSINEMAEAINSIIDAMVALGRIQSSSSSTSS